MNKFLTTAVMAAIAGAASADVIADWAAAPNGTSIAAMNVFAGATALDLTRGPGLNQASGATFNSNGWDDATDAASALANGNYLQWGVGGFSGGSLDSLEIRIDVSGTGPDFYQVLASTDNFASSSVVLDVDTMDNTDGIDYNVALGLVGLNGDVTFRLVGWGATSGNGTLDIETIDFANGGTYGIRLNGNLVPTPGAIAVAGLGGLVAARRRRA